MDNRSILYREPSLFFTLLEDAKNAGQKCRFRRTAQQKREPAAGPCAIQTIGSPAQDVVQTDPCGVVAAHDVPEIIGDEVGFLPREDDLALDVGDDPGLPQP